jgi:hypothetical protein
MSRTADSACRLSRRHLSLYSYIAREGKYADRLKLGEKLEATAAGNMPAWAQHNAQEFWRAADAHGRVNGTTCREMEIALPRELSAEQRADLVRDSCAKRSATSMHTSGPFTRRWPLMIKSSRT